MANIQNIAKLAGVSKATVSRILNNDPSFSVSESTKKRVWTTANKLNYKLSNAVSKSTDDKLHLAVISALSINQELKDPYFQQIMAGMDEQADLWGLKITSTVHFPLIDDMDWEKLSIYGAVIVIGEFSEEILSNIYTYNKNIIIIDDVRTFDDYDVISNDFKSQTGNILNILYKKGHRKIAFVGGKKNMMGEKEEIPSSNLDVRQQAYLNWMKLHGLEKNINQQIVGWHSGGSVMATKKILGKKEKPTAIITASDLQAIEVYRTVQELGYSIPKDIAVVGFDDIETSKYLYPSLTTVRPAAKEMGKEAISLARDKIVGEHKSSIQVIVNSKLIIRESI